jgi:hypothetical protein
MGFSHYCEERKRAEIAAATCDLMASTTYILIETNRRIGPTTPKHLFNAASKENYPAMEILYKVLGKNITRAYLEDIADMSTYIADRNITDLITLPKKEFKVCLGGFGYRVER